MVKDREELKAVLVCLFFLVLGFIVSGIMTG